MVELEAVRGRSKDCNYVMDHVFRWAMIIINSKTDY